MTQTRTAPVESADLVAAITDGLKNLTIMTLYGAWKTVSWRTANQYDGKARTCAADEPLQQPCWMLTDGTKANTVRGTSGPTLAAIAAMCKQAGTLPAMARLAVKIGENGHLRRDWRTDRGVSVERVKRTAKASVPGATTQAPDGKAIELPSGTQFEAM
jgi:hypothetical protein